MSLAFAFEGCACRAAFHAGAVAWLVERGVRPLGASGASSGALVAAAVAAELDDLEARWEELLGRTRPIDLRRLLGGRWPGAMSEVLGGVLDDHLGARRLAELPREVAIVVTQLGLRGRTRRTLTRADDLPVRTAVLASCFVPGIYARMVPIDGRPAVDGAWQVRTPAGEARALGAERVVCFVTHPDGRLRRGLVRERAEAPPDYARVVAPAEPLPLRGFDFDRERTRGAFAAGRRAAEAFARREEAWLALAAAS